MSDANTHRSNFFRQALFAVWAMATLILFFTVVLLVKEMAEKGMAPLDIRTREAIGPPPDASVRVIPAQREARDILLYFPARDVEKLMPETRRVSAGESTAENCRIVLQELISGPKDDRPAALPKSSRLRAVYLLENGELVVDFTRELQLESAKQAQSASTEALMVYAVVNTLCQPSVRGPDGAVVRSVRFLVEGRPPGESFPVHLDLSGPISAEQRWIGVTEVLTTGDA